MYTQFLSRYSAAKDITNWQDYIEENKKDKKIFLYLSRIGQCNFRCHIAKRSKCIHQSFLSIEHCVDELLQMFDDPDYVKLKNNCVYKEMRKGKTLCHHCILFCCIKTDKFNNFFTYLEKALCNNTSCIADHAGGAIFEFSQAIVSYPIIMKYIVNQKSVMRILLKILLFYFEMDIDNLSTEYITYYIISDEYKVSNKSQLQKSLKSTPFILKLSKISMHNGVV
eukprot:11471_1